MAFFDSAPTSAPTATPSAGDTAAPTPTSQGTFFSNVSAPASTAPQATSKTFFSNISAPSTATSKEPTSTSPGMSPYWQGADDLGDTFGPSKTIDPSGRPLLDYKQNGAESTTTDKTRTDTVFNPMVAAPQKQTDIATPRTVSTSEKTKIKQEAGSPKSDVIDHAMALTVAGSNEPENLRPEPNDLNSKQGTFESDLDNQVRTGKISLFDAQKLEAANKGLPEPFTGSQSPSFWGKVTSYLENAKNDLTSGGPSLSDRLFPSDSTQQKISNGLATLSSYVANKINEGPIKVNPDTKDFLKALPQSVAENLPLGVGQVVQQIEQDPTNADNVNLGDIIHGLPEAGKDFISSMIAQPVLTIAGAILAPFVALKDPNGPQGGQITIDIPGLGKVSNLQADVAQKVQKGENPWQAALDETPGAIFDTLAVVGLTEKLTSPRQVTIIKGEAPDMTPKEGPKSLREYKPVVTTTPVPPDILQKIANEKGIDLTKNYDPKQPTFFRFEGDAQGKTVTPSIVQIKPSYVDTFFNKFGGNASAVPSTEVIPLYQQPIKLDDIIKSTQDITAKPISSTNENGLQKANSEVSPGTNENKVSSKLAENSGSSKGLTVYRSSDTSYNPLKVGKAGVFVSPSEHVANFFNENGTRPTEKLSISSDAKILQWKDVPEKFKNYDNKDIADVQGKLADYARSKGFDVVNYEPKDGYPNGIEHQIVNPNILSPSKNGNSSIKSSGVIPQKGTRYYPIGRGPKMSIDKVADALKEFVPKGNIKYAFDPNLLKEKGALGSFEHSPKMEALNPKLKPIINLMQKGNKVYARTAFHEAYHYLENKVFSPEFVSKLNQDTLATMNKGDHDYYKARGYKTDNERASEYRADEFGKKQSEKAGYKSPIKKIIDAIKNAVQKIIDIGKTMKNYINAIPNTQGGFIANPLAEDDGFEHIGGIIDMDIADDLNDLEKRGAELAVRQEVLKNNPASQLSKYTNKSTGELPEVLGDGISIFGKKGDDIVTQLGFKDSESARKAYTKYVSDKKALESDMEKFKADKKEVINNLKEQEAKNTQEYRDKFNPDITEANKGVVPPEVRGGIHAPEMDISEFKDKAAIRLGRDTMERNIEKVVPAKNVSTLQKFLIDPVRKNETDRVNFNNELRKEIRGKMDELGIKRGSKEDELMQRFGEKMMTRDDLLKATPKTAHQIESGADYFRKIYDDLIDKWNTERAKFNYRPVAKRPDYFRHFSDINQFTNSFGFLRSESQLPTEIAGQTPFFKPGKPFSTAEMHRTGNLTSYSAMGGMDNYLDSVSKQIYHIDSIQRGRALEKYIREVAKKDPEVKLSNFVSNVQEWTNLISGKAAMLDRAIESTVGRPIMKFTKGLSNLVARNIIGGNISVALTHLVSTPLQAATTDKAPLVQGLLHSLISPLKSEPITHIDGQESSFLTRRFPEKYIQPSTFDKTQETLNWLFKITDMFKSKATVAGKYYEGLRNGLSKEDAMDAADKYAGRIIGDYSTGSQPNLMNTNTLKLMAQFQLGVNDGLSVLLHDIPHWEKGNKVKIGYRLVAFAVFSYLFNQLYKQIRGSGKGLDPIDAGLTLTGLNDEGKGQSVIDRAKLAGSDIAGELPFTSIFTGNFPLATSVVQPLENLITGASSRKTAATTLAADLISPIGGGNQAKKTIEGVDAVQSGKTTTGTGATNTLVPQTPTNYIKGAVFGPSVFNAISGANNQTTQLINLLSANKGSVTTQAEQEYSKMKAMSPADATAEFNNLKASNPSLAKTISAIADEEALGMTLNERLTKELGVANGQRADYITKQLNALPDAKSKTDLWTRYVTLKIISPQVADQITSLLNK